MTAFCTSRGCDRPTRDAAYVCENCLDDLARALGDVAWLAEELEISRTKQRAAAITGTTAASRTTSLPWHERASEAERNLRAQLVTWVRWCEEEGVRHSSPHDETPADTMKAMSAWLLWRVDGLAWCDLGGEAVAQITSAVAKAESVVFYKRASRLYLGRCPYEQACAGEVYAIQGEATGKCDLCGTVVSVDQRRQALEKQLDDRLCTAAEIARLSTYLGLGVDRERVRKQVNYWARHKRILPSASSGTGDPTYRYGQVRSLLYTEFGRSA